LHRRHQEADEQADDRDHDEEFYEREAAAKHIVFSGATDWANGGLHAATV
jgi:hypothetical protein